jgi:hypothetical protein
MLRQLITTISARQATSRVNAARLNPGELREILEALPDVARKLRARQSTQNVQPRSICTSLKDLCEL